MIKVKQQLSSLPTTGNKEIEKIKSELKSEFKTLYTLKDKLENENKAFKKIIEQAKREYQSLYKENQDKDEHIDYYRQYTENLLLQVKKLEAKINDLENEKYYYEPPIVKRPRYSNLDENYDHEEEEQERIEHDDYDIIEKTSPKKNTKKVGISKYIKQ